jgi:hypothetical protein
VKRAAPRRGIGRRGAARRRNPGAGLSAAERAQLARATRLSSEFHGAPRVLELSPAERRLPRFVALIGDQVETAYRPDDGSKRGRAVWHHKSGDRGPLRGPGRGATKRPKVVALPDGRVVTLPAGSPQRFTSRGLVD